MAGSYDAVVAAMNMKHGEVLARAATKMHTVQSYPLTVEEYYVATEGEVATLTGHEARAIQLAGDEKVIRDIAESALEKLGKMVQIFIASTLGVIALIALHDTESPPLITAVATIVWLVGFGLAIGVGIFLARHRLLYLQWPVHLLQLRKSQLHTDVEALVTGFQERHIYLDFADFQKSKNNVGEHHVTGEEFFLESLYGVKIHCILSSSGLYKEDLIRWYEAIMWGYGFGAVAVLIVGVTSVVLELVYWHTSEK